jgi:excisionase family DNA binding protein
MPDLSQFLGAAISTRQAATELGVTIQAVAARVHRGTIRAAKVGGRWKLDAADLERKGGGRPVTKEPKPKRPRGRPRKTTTTNESTTP